MDKFGEAIAFSQAHEIPWPRDPAADPARWGVHHDDPPPFNRLRGPVHPRGGVSGVIRVRGKEVAAWGEPDRADQTYSVAKTYLALLAGIAHAKGLLEPGERVSERLPGIGFDSDHNRAITWLHLLTQTSEWQGECFGMPDQVEHNRRVSHDPKPPGGKKGELRSLRAPGTYWEYNDVRINQFSLALLHLFKRPLPEVFLESVLKPIGGGRDFRWEGYDDSWVEIGGRKIQSVPGGTHWGGGVTVSARDQARVGQLMLDGGLHDGKQLVPREWAQRMHAPCAVAPFYGWLTWLNGDGRMYADASRASFFMFGAGGHTVWIDPENEAVVVTRWLDGAHSAGFVSRVVQALRS
ncbi:serine hydrolase [Betaproteobacteria bacterium GR16-43]|nr:serine hydrolase [Betaproteobacteria bacterium GR16-43]